MACGACPLCAGRTIRSRPCGVSRAFLWTFIRLPRGSLKRRQLQLPRPEPDGQPMESSHLVEIVDPGSVAAGDLGLLFFGAVAQNLFDDLPASGEGGFDVGVIRAPEEIVDADDVSVADAHGIFLKAGEHVSVEIVARQHRLLEAITLLL